MSRKRAFAYCLGVFLAVRVGVALVGWLAVDTFPSRGPVSVAGWREPAPSGSFTDAVTSLERQDALWYLRIADDGYAEGDGSAAFFPLFPGATWLVAALLGGRELAGGLLVANAAALGALFVLFQLSQREYGVERARRTVLYLAVFPSALFLYAPYSESLYLLAAVLSLWGARRGRWWVAGIAGFAAALTRSVGWVLAPVLVVEALHQRREGRGGPGAGLTAAAGPVAGTLAYLAWWQATAGDWSAPLSAQSGWERDPAFPLVTLWRAITQAWSLHSYWLLDLLIVAPVIAGAVWVAFRARPSYAVFAWLSLLVPLCLVFEGRALMSVPRFAVVIFPAFWAFAVATEAHRIPHDLWLGASAAGLAVMTMLFANNWFVF